MDTGALNLRQPVSYNKTRRRVCHELSDRLICLLYWAYLTHFRQTAGLAVGTVIPGRHGADFYRVLYEFMPLRHGWQASKFHEELEKLGNAQDLTTKQKTAIENVLSGGTGNKRLSKKDRKKVSSHLHTLYKECPYLALKLLFHFRLSYLSLNEGHWGECDDVRPSAAEQARREQVHAENAMIILRELRPLHLQSQEQDRARQEAYDAYHSARQTAALEAKKNSVAAPDVLDSLDMPGLFDEVSDW